jgi:hypothetical protein
VNVVALGTSGNSAAIDNLRTSLATTKGATETRLQTEFLGNGRARPFSRLEREVDVLKGIQGGGAIDLSPEFLGQELALLE